MTIKEQFEERWERLTAHGCQQDHLKEVIFNWVLWGYERKEMEES